MAKKVKATARDGSNRLTQELLATASDMRASDLLTERQHEEIMLRHVDNIAPATSAA